MTSMMAAEDINLSHQAKKRRCRVFVAARATDRSPWSKRWRRERRERRGDWAEPSIPSPDSRNKKTHGVGVEHPWKWGTHFITNNNGTEICFRFAKGAPGACGEPCPDQRAHVCQHCPGKHTNDTCPSHVKKDSKGSGKASKKGAGK